MRKWVHYLFFAVVASSCSYRHQAHVEQSILLRPLTNNWNYSYRIIWRNHEKAVIIVERKTGDKWLPYAEATLVEESKDLHGFRFHVREDTGDDEFYRIDRADPVQNEDYLLAGMYWDSAAIRLKVKKNSE